MGAGVIIVFPHVGMVVFGLPIPVGFILFALWQAFYRNPQVIIVKDSGIELRFRSREPKFVPWQEVEKIEMPVPDPVPIRAGGKPTSLASLKIRAGPRSHVAIHEVTSYSLTYDTAKTLSELKQECEIK